jgi:hypothetical protein
MVGPMIIVHVGALAVHTGVELSRRQYVKYEYVENVERV